MKWALVIVIGLLVVGYWFGMQLLESYNQEIKDKDLGDIMKEYNKAIEDGQKQYKEKCN